MTDELNDIRQRIRGALDACGGLIDLGPSGTLDRMADAAMAVIEDESVERMVKLFVDESRFRSLEVRDGSLHLEMQPAREIVGMWAGAARALLTDAENYAEIEMEFRDAATAERYAFTVQRIGKMTPHQLRRQAEGERDELRRQLEQARYAEEH